ncbi:MAG: purine-nucleoside phosphorylase [Acidimicrobiia bacterium]|jgi:purine-nucleoside phosphorylase
MSYHTIMAAAAVIAARSERDRHDAAVVLGSGLSAYARSLPEAVELPYQGIPGFPTPQVAGHAGSLFSVRIEGRAVLVFAGRVHSYEGWDMDDIVFGVRTAVATGARRVLLTNAAGAVNESFSPGDLVVISDHLNLSGRNPLTGPNDDRLGPRFPDMTEVYTRSLRSRLKEILTDRGLPAHEGVYAAFPGPTYETPAEVQMAKRLGADLVGMSTVPEAIAVRHMGAEVAGISLVTNLAAGISRTPLSHAEVTETAMRSQTVFAGVVDAFLPTLISD